MKPIRLVVAATHPVQYLAPWFRELSSRDDLELEVLYAARPNPAQQGVGFETAFEWDSSLTEGYSNRIVGVAEKSARFDSDSFFGIDVPAMGSAVVDTDPDVVLVSGWHSLALVRSIWASRARGIPVLYRGDSNLQVAHVGIKRIAWRLRTRLLLSLFSGYLSVGRRAREYLESFGIAPQRIFDSPHAVDVSFFREEAIKRAAPSTKGRLRARHGIPEDAYVALFVGKLDENKRPQDLMRALAMLGKPWVGVFAGSGESSEKLTRLASELGVPAQFLGFLNQKELPEAYAMADCLALPSGRESWGLVVNEALASGVPCVVSEHVGCAPDLVVPGETGEICEAGDVESLASALSRLRQWRGHEPAPLPACIRHIERYTYRQSSEGLVRACRAVTSGGIGE